VENEGLKEKDGFSLLTMSGKELLQELKKEEVHFSFISKPKLILSSKKFYDLPVKDKVMLIYELDDIIVDDIPSSLHPFRSISHHIGLIPGESPPNKAMYKMTLQENEEVKSQLPKLLDKIFVKEILSPFFAPIVLIPNKNGG